jgi:hypothetical protein
MSDLEDLHPLVKKGIKEGRIDPRDAKWLSEYARTPGDTRVETGKKYPDMSERMENYMNRVKSGEATGKGFKENKLELGGSRGGGGGSGMGDVGIKGIGKKSKLDYAKGGMVTKKKAPASKAKATASATKSRTNSLNKFYGK